MLYISYGIAKSGSTLAFELSKELLRQHGHPQERLDSPALRAEARINFANDLSPEALGDLLGAVDERKILVVKTHSGPTPAVSAALATGRIKAQAVYRDPREIVLSLMDAGAKGRELEAQLGKKRGFSEIETLDDAVTSLSKQVRHFDRWMKLKGVAPALYDDVAFRPEIFLRAVEEQLGLPQGRVDYASVHSTVSGGAFTQFNKGVRARHEADMSEADQAIVLSRFADFYARHHRLNEPGA